MNLLLILFMAIWMSLRGVLEAYHHSIRKILPINTKKITDNTIIELYDAERTRKAWVVGYELIVVFLISYIVPMHAPVFLFVFLYAATRWLFMEGWYYVLTGRNFFQIEMYERANGEKLYPSMVGKTLAMMIGHSKVARAILKILVYACAVLFLYVFKSVH